MRNCGARIELLNIIDHIHAYPYIGGVANCDIWPMLHTRPFCRFVMFYNLLCYSGMKWVVKFHLLITAPHVRTVCASNSAFPPFLSHFFLPPFSRLEPSQVPATDPSRGAHIGGLADCQWWSGICIAGRKAKFLRSSVMPVSRRLMFCFERGVGDVSGVGTPE